MSNVTDLSAYAGKRFNDGYQFAMSENPDYWTAFEKGGDFLRGYEKAAFEQQCKEIDSQISLHKSGWNAYVAGKHKADCPFDNGSMEEQHWTEAWASAEHCEATEFLETESFLEKYGDYTEETAF